MTYADVLNKIMTEKQFENTRFVSVNRFFYKYAKKWYESVPIKDVVYFFHCEVLDFCNCGVPKYTQSAICKILTIQNDNSLSYEDKKVQYKKQIGLDIDEDISCGIWQFILYRLDKSGIVEHGSSIGGCWLTDLGKMYLFILEKWVELGSPDF